MTSTGNETLRGELNLVVECGRWCLRAEADGADALPFAEDINWGNLIETARRHRMVPWVHRCLRTRSGNGIPSEVCAQLRILSQQIAMKSLFLTAELLKVIDLMSSEGICCLPFKGPMLGMLCYGDLSLRECDDIDLLISPKEIWRAKESLQSHGYDFWRHCSESDQKRLLRKGWAFTFTHSKTNLHVDLHWRFTAPGFSFPFDVEALWNRLETVQLSGREVLAFPAEDVILLHCVHGSKHQWERLEWIYALSGLLRRSSGLDWNLLLVRAQQLRAERMLLLGLRLASDIFGTSLSDVLHDRMDEDKALPSLVRQVQSRLVCQDGVPVLEAQQYAFHFRMRENWLDRVRYFVYLVGRKMLPTAKDHEAIPLPAVLSGLHYFARPFRLLNTYGLNPLKRFFSNLRST